MATDGPSEPSSVAAPGATPAAPETPGAPETPAVAVTGVDPRIVAMEDALDRGDHVRTREIARELSSLDNSSLRRTGEAMLARLRPDGVVVGVLVGTGFLIVALALGYLGRH